jgi:hypothetical protein
MSKIRECISDCRNNVVFAVTMARDVAKYLKEEKKKDKLCLQL